LDWAKMVRTFQQLLFPIADKRGISPESMVDALICSAGHAMGYSRVTTMDEGFSRPASPWLGFWNPSGTNKSLSYDIIHDALLQGLAGPMREAGLTAVFLYGSSLEAKGMLLSQNEGMGYEFVEELADWVLQFQGNNSAEGRYLKLYDGKAWIRVTLDGDKSFQMQQTRMMLSVFSQAGPLYEFYSAFKATGLTWRLLCATAPVPLPTYQEMVDAPEPDWDALPNVFEGIWDNFIHNNDDKDWKVYALDEDAQAIFEVAFDELQVRLAKMMSDCTCTDDLRGLYAKLKGLYLATAGPIQAVLCAHANENMQFIGLEAMTASIEVVNWCAACVAELLGIFKSKFTSTSVSNHELTDVGLLLLQPGSTVALAQLRKQSVSFSGSILAAGPRGTGAQLFKQAETAGFGEFQSSTNSSGPKAIYFTKVAPDSLAEIDLDPEGVTMQAYTASYKEKLSPACLKHLKALELSSAASPQAPPLARSPSPKPTDFLDDPEEKKTDKNDGPSQASGKPRRKPNSTKPQPQSKGPLLASPASSSSSSSSSSPSSSSSSSSSDSSSSSSSSSPPPPGSKRSTIAQSSKKSKKPNTKAAKSAKADTATTKRSAAGTPPVSSDTEDDKDAPSKPPSSMTRAKSRRD
jgi:hypothetical protein